MAVTVHKFPISVSGIDLSHGCVCVCVKSTFAACLQMDDASSRSGKWEPVQRAEPYAEAGRQVPLSVCLPPLPLPSLGGFTAPSEDMRRRKARRKRGIQEEEERWRGGLSYSRSDNIDSWEEVICRRQR